MQPGSCRRRSKNRRNKRDEIVWLAGDYDQLSGLLGVIRGNEIIANAPYIFFKHESNIRTMVSKKGMMYDAAEKIIEREVLAISKESSEKYGVKVGDIVTLDDYDLFDVKLSDELAITAVNDCDILCL